MNILYLTFVDLSKPSGPSANEIEFITEIVKDKTVNVDFALTEVSLAMIPKNHNGRTFKLPSIGYQSLFYRLDRLYDCVEFCKVISQYKYDVIISRLSIIPLPELFILNKLNTPYYIKTLSGGFVSISHGGGVKGVVSKPFVYLEKVWMSVIIRNACHADVCTNALRALSYRMWKGGGKITVVPNAVNTDRFSVPLKQEKDRLKSAYGLGELYPVLGYAGSRPSQRGAKHIVHALNYYRESYPQMGGLIVGGDSELEEVKLLAHKYGIDNRIHFSGVVPFEKVASYIKAMDIGIAMDDPARSYVVGNSNQKVRQYIATGLPFITTKQTDINVDSANGFTVNSNKYQEFNATVDEMLKTKYLFSERAAQDRRKYALEKLSTQSAYLRRKSAIEKQLGIKYD